MEELNNIYDRIYSTYDNYNDENTTGSKEKAVYIDNFVDMEGDILDAGCGSGYNLRRLFNSGYASWYR